MSTVPSLTLEQEPYLALSVLAYMFVRMGQLERAERVYRVLEQAQPEDIQAQLGLALASLQRRQGEETLHHLDRISKGISDKDSEEAAAEQDSESARALRPLRTVLLLMRTEAAAVAAQHASKAQSSREQA